MSFEENKITIEPVDNANIDDLFHILTDDLRRIIRKIGSELMKEIEKNFIPKKKVSDAIDKFMRKLKAGEWFDSEELKKELNLK